MKTIEFQIKEGTTEEELNYLASFIRKNISPAFEIVEKVSVKEYTEIEIDDDMANETYHKMYEEAIKLKQ